MKASKGSLAAGDGGAPVSSDSRPSEVAPVSAGERVHGVPERSIPRLEPAYFDRLHQTIEESGVREKPWSQSLRESQTPFSTGDEEEVSRYGRSR